MIFFKMRKYNVSHSLFIFLVLFFVNSGCCQKMMDLYENQICRRGETKSSNHICRVIYNCKIALDGIKKGIRYPICSFRGLTPIICCPPVNVTFTPNITPVTPQVTPHITPATSTLVTPPSTHVTASNSITKSNTTKKWYSADEMCLHYSQFIYQTIKNPLLISQSSSSVDRIKNCHEVEPLIVGGTKAKSKEFSHMALLGYNEDVDSNEWNCGGSLISNRWILSAAHCNKLGLSNYPRWARLGELDYSTTSDDTQHKNYKIDQRVMHPNYNAPSRYNDIGLYHLDEDVEFTPYIRPICLNTDRSLNTLATLATGWGRIDFAEPLSEHLLKVVINITPGKECNSTYSSIVKSQLQYGIDDKSMICAGISENGKGTCTGDSGGPIQIRNTQNYECMYTQIGISSFGITCGVANIPGVFTRVSNYISWIEPIVWPKS